jgi:SNF2 family DNA or RNA helicase
VVNNIELQSNSTPRSMSYTLATSKLQGRLIVPYQRDGVRWMLRRETGTHGPRGGFLCDEMGLGKTIQIIATMLGNPLRRSLVIVPKSIVNQWGTELNKFAPEIKVNLFDGPMRQFDEEAQVTIAPYSVLVVKKQDPGTSILHKYKWDRIVMDEGHEIRNPSSKVFRNAFMIVAPIRWIISGTPVYNSMKDFITLCKFIGLSKQDVLSYKNAIHKKYILRRTKKDVAAFNTRLELPPCDFANVELEMNDHEKQLYELVFSDSCDRLKEIFKQENYGMHAMHILECFLRTRQAMIWPQLYIDGIAAKRNEEPQKWRHGSKKMDTLVEMLKSHPSEKSLIFCQFMGEMNYIQSLFPDKVFRIDGSVEQSLRVSRIEEFKKTPGAIFLIQIKAGGQGLNLQDATRVYITCPSWNPATELQAIARSHRTGQTQRVVVRKLVYKGTLNCPSIEESMMELQNHKAIMCAEVLNDPEIADQLPQSSNKVSIFDIKKIFRV